MQALASLLSTGLQEYASSWELLLMASSDFVQIVAGASTTSAATCLGIPHHAVVPQQDRALVQN